MKASDIRKGTVVQLKDDTKTTRGMLKKGTKLEALGSPVGSGWFYGRIDGKGERYQLKVDWVKRG